jgi:hypothetical protein
MGAWGHQPFDNDDSADLIDELVDAGEFHFAGLFERVKAGALEPEGTHVVAAAAFVAAAKTGDKRFIALELEEAELDEWFEASRPQLAALAPDALTGLQTIRKDSELKDLWSESDEFAKWDEALATIEKQLG